MDIKKFILGVDNYNMAEENKIDENGKNARIPQEVPLLALKNSVVFPFLATPLVVGRKKSIEAINNASKEHKIIVVVAQREENKDLVEKEDLYDIGTACAIKQVVNISDDEIKCTVEGIARVKIKYFTQTEPYFRVFTEPLIDEPFALND
jgi:ATP-dependent Lon protease